MISRTLGDIAEFINGRAFKPTEWSETGLPIIRIQNLNDENKPYNYFDGDYAEKHLIQKGDLLLSWSGTPGTSFGCFIWERESGLLNQHIFKVHLDEEICTKKFFMRAVNKNLNLLIDQAHGGVGLKHITKAKLVRIKIPLPPLPVQQKIASILDTADALKQKDKDLIAKYDELTQSLFLDMFGDPVNNPKGWEKKTVAKVLQRKSQNGLYLPKDKYGVDGVEMVHMSDAFYGTVTTGNLKRVILTNKELEKHLLSKEDVLLARRSLTLEGAAKPCLIPQYDKPLVYESSLIRITPNKDIITPLYLYFFFSNERAKGKYVNKYITCATISGINNKGLNAIEILVPPIALQKQFAERINAIEQQKQQAQASLKKSEDLFNCLLQKAFKGELMS